MSQFRLVDVNVVYGNKANEVYALKNICVNISRGEKIAIVGKSGSGKSTLLNVMSGIEKIQSGKIFYNDVMFSNITEKIKSKIRLLEFGFVFQAFHLISTLSVYDNICLPLAASKNNIDKGFFYSYKKILIELYPKQGTYLYSYPTRLIVIAIAISFFVTVLSNLPLVMKIKKTK